MPSSLTLQASEDVDMAEDGDDLVPVRDEQIREAWDPKMYHVPGLTSVLNALTRASFYFSLECPDTCFVLLQS